MALVKGDVGLGNVDDTSDANKPVSTAQQTALDLKANLASPTFTGTPAAPTAAVNTNTTQVATTAFVNAEILADAAPIAHVGSGGTSHAVVMAGGAAGFMSGADKAKLDGVAAGATANSTDAHLKDRANHTGEQAISTVTGLGTAVAGKAPLTGVGASGTWPISVTGQSGSFAVIDDRNVVSQPNQVPDRSGVFNFRFKENVGSPPFPASSTYAHVLTINGWTADGTGGWPTQMSFGERLSYRKGDTSTIWGAWRQLVDSASIGEFAPSLTGGGATGNWGISVTGNAATATKLATPRAINGVNFDGTANISVQVDWSAVTGKPAVIVAGADAATARSAIGAASLVGGKIPEHELPSLAITDVFPVASEAAMLALTAEKGDMAIRSDLNKCFALSATPASTLANWLELKTPANAVMSVAGRTGAVTLSSSDVGLANVNNTSDANKPVSTATQTALNLKANLASPVFTGTPSAPSVGAGVNTTQIANTAYVFAERTNTATLTNKTLTNPILTSPIFNDSFPKTIAFIREHIPYLEP